MKTVGVTMVDVLSTFNFYILFFIYYITKI